MEWAQGVYNTGASIDVFCVLRYCSIYSTRNPPLPPYSLSYHYVGQKAPHPWLELLPGLATRGQEEDPRRKASSVAAMLAWPTLIPTAKWFRITAV